MKTSSSQSQQPIGQPANSLSRLWLFVRQRQCLLTRLCFFAIMIYILAGCQSRPLVPAEPEAAEIQTAPAQEKTADFAPGSLLGLLTAEIAGYRNQPMLALEQYSKQARITQNPQIASRAYEIANYLDAHQVGYRNALLWVELQPDSQAAQQAAALELYRAKEYAQAGQHLQQSISLDPAGEYLELVAFAANHADADSRQQLQQLIGQQQHQQPDNHNLVLASAILLMEDKPLDAYYQLERIDNRQADSRILHIKARMLEQLEQLEASLATQDELIRHEPRDENARKFRARLLINLERLELARAEFLELAKLDPQDDDYRLSLGYINMDMQAWEEASVYFAELLERGSYRNNALYNLATCQAELGNQQQALDYYQQVAPGQYWLKALQQQALLLLQDNNEEAFADLLQQARQQQPDQDRLISQVEARARMSLKHNRRALLAINQALQQYPQDKDLLYLRALTAERLDDLKQLEDDLRTILRQSPQDSIALNALGYTLVDRTERLEEGFSLIEQALLLNPNDPPTMDSMGWALYRMGEPKKALDYLRQAMQAMPDAEVAAHLGEVLWASGKKRQARNIWQQGLELDATDEVLLETIQRLDKRKKWF